MRAGAADHRCRRSLGACAASLAALVVSAQVVGADGGLPVEPHALWRAWSWDPTVIVPLVVVAWAYARGVGRLWGRAGVGHGVGRGQVTAFAAGLATITVALVSPLDTVNETLFAAHMGQHLLLMLVAAPLLVLGMPSVPFLWALPLAWRRALGHWWKGPTGMRTVWHTLTHPLVVWSLNVAALWIWHLPTFYELALASVPVHASEHACFLGASLLFWWAVLHPSGRRRLGGGMSVLYVFAMGMQMSILGALLTFSTALWYPAQEAQSAAWGLTPLADQQLAGVIMWVPAGVLYLIAAAALFLAWMRDAEATMRRREGRVQDDHALRAPPLPLRTGRG